MVSPPLRSVTQVPSRYQSPFRLAILSTPLLFFPRILSLIFGSLLTESGDPEGEGKAEVIRQLNVLERSLAGMTGLSCLTLAAVLIIQVSLRLNREGSQT